MLVIGLVLVAGFILVAIFAPLLAPYGFAQPARTASIRRQQPPSAQHWFGTTVRGDDVFSRVIWGAQTALIVIVLSMVLSMLLGVVLGLVSGYRGGWLDRVLVLVMDAIYAFPSLLLAIVVSIVIGPGSRARGAASCRPPSRSRWSSSRSTSAWSARDAVRSRPSRSSSPPASSAPARRESCSATCCATSPALSRDHHAQRSEAILTLAGLGFLGFGIEPTAAAEWGYDLNKALSDVTSGIWWTAMFPGLGDRARRARHHPGRREPQRPARPAAAHPTGGELT